MKTSFKATDLLPGTLCYIYTLHASNDPECKPRYVGFTTRLKRRQIEHNTGRKAREGRKGEWVRTLLGVGEKVVLTVVFSFRSDDIAERGMIEAAWVESYRNRYHDLLNDAPAGYGVSPCSETLRNKRRLMNLGRKPTAEQREKVRQSKLGKPRPPEVIAALRKANLGKKFSAERRRQVSERMKGKKLSPEVRRQRSAKMWMKKLTGND